MIEWGVMGTTLLPSLKIATMALSSTAPPEMFIAVVIIVLIGVLLVQVNLGQTKE